MQFIFSQWVRLKAFLKLLITLSAVLMSPAL
ncbi:HupE/UreJ family protein, partial [Acinetobacter baumannii]